MIETEVEIGNECEESLKEALLDLCSGIPDELPIHPGLDERYESYSIARVMSRRRRTAISVSCTCLGFLRIFRNILSGLSAVRIQSVFSVRCLPIQILSVSILSPVRTLRKNPVRLG